MGELAKVRVLNPVEQQQRIDALERQVGELQATIAALRAELEQLTRRGKRQAAPFSKDERVANPKRPGRKPGQGTFHFRTAPHAVVLWLILHRGFSAKLHRPVYGQGAPA